MLQILKKKIKIFSSILFAVLMVSSFSFQMQAQQKENSKKYIKLEVDGLACPFCAYGLEKNLRNNIEGLDDLYINIENGYVTFSFPKQDKLKNKKLEDIIEEAGFKARKISFSDKPFPKGEEK